MQREVRTLLSEVGRLLLAGELQPLVRIETVPAGEVLAVEEGAEALWWRVGEQRERKEAGDEGAHFYLRVSI